MKKVAFAAIVFFLVVSSSAMAEYVAFTATVSIPENIPGLYGQIATAPVEIDNAYGVSAFDFEILYDTALLDLSNSDVYAGSLTASGWTISSNVDDSQGKALVNGFATEALGSVSGSLLELDFHVTATSGTSALMPSGNLNEGNIYAYFTSGCIDIVPEPSMIASLLCLFAAAAFVFKKRR